MEYVKLLDTSFQNIQKYLNKDYYSMALVYCKQVVTTSGSNVVSSLAHGSCASSYTPTAVPTGGLKATMTATGEFFIAIIYSLLKKKCMKDIIGYKNNKKN